MDTIEQRVKNAIAIFVGVAEDMKPETNLANDLGADSIEMVEITMELESEFEIDIPDEDADKITTVQQAVDYITQRVPA